MNTNDLVESERHQRGGWMRCAQQLAHAHVKKTEPPADCLERGLNPPAEWLGTIGTDEGDFVHRWKCLASSVHRSAVDHGFWEFPNVSEKLALIHGEVSECLEATRAEGWRTNPSEHIPEHTAVAEELADIIIRTMDLGTHLGLDVATAILDKVRCNAGRPFKHGKRF